MVLRVRLFLQLKQVVKWVVEENVSLDNFVTLDIKLVFSKDFHSVVVELLAIN